MKKIVANTTATSEEIQWEREFEEMTRILGKARLPWQQLEMIERVFARSSDKLTNSYWGSINVYELGRINGIREERERRKRARGHKLPVVM